MVKVLQDILAELRPELSFGIKAKQPLDLTVL